MTEETTPDAETIVDAIERAPVGIAVSDPDLPDNPIVYANEGFTEITGYQKEEIIGRNCRFLQCEETDPERVAEIRAAVDGAERIETELVNERRDGERFWNHLRIAPVGQDGTVTHFVGFQYDVTERRRREAAMGALHEATAALMDASERPAVAEIAIDTAERALNRSLVCLWLLDDGGLLRPAASTAATRALFDDLPTFRPGEGLAGTVFESGTVRVFDNVHEEAERISEDTPIGSEIILPLGEYGVLIVGSETPRAFDRTDVSIARTLANATTAALAQADREETLREQRERLEAQNERLEEFAGIVSHDLRNPLNVAQGRLELARQECDSEHLEPVAGAHDRMLELIDDLLDLARQGAGAESREPVALADVAAECWETVDSDSATLAVETERSIEADEDRLRQLLENLFRNAIEHAGPDVAVTLGDCDGGFFVDDDGPGIPPDDRDRVLESGVTTAEDGTGLGLAIVRDVAEAHGWTVAVGETAAGGARIEITGVEQAAGS